MKKLLLAAAFFIGVPLSFTSCNNGAYDADPVTDLSSVSNPLSVPGGPYYMSCNVDNQVFTGKASFVGTNALGIVNATATGTISNDTAQYQMQVGVFNYSVPGAYTEPDSTVLISLGPTSDPMNAYLNTGAGNTCVVTITELNSDYINGTFSGRIRNGGAYHMLSNGTFHVKKY